MGNERKLDVKRSTSTSHRLTEYDGVCGDLHGHNLKWEIELTVDMEGTGSDNMPLDLKAVSEFLDTHFDHGCVLSSSDRLFDALDVQFKDDEEYPLLTEVEPLGKVLVVDSGDPTCEVLSGFVSDYFTSLDGVAFARVMVYETDQYGISASEITSERLK